MKRIIISIALLLGTAVATQAQAAPAAMYKDLIRPNGHVRSQAVYQADVDGCYRQTGASRYRPDNASMKKCMSSHGYRFEWQRSYASGGSRRSGRSTYDPTFDIPTQPTAEPQVPDPNSFNVPQVEVPTVVIPPSPVPPAYDSSGALVPGTGM